MADLDAECLRSDIIALLHQNERFSPEEYFSVTTESHASGDSRDVTFARLLENFVHLEFSEADAILHWKNILQNARELETRTGRKIGIHTALVDYFTNKKPMLNSPMLVEVRLFRQTEQLAMIDGLTGIFNRRYMETILKKEYTRCERYSKEFSVCLIDIDDFKRVNDTRGHLFGDYVLKELASLLKESVREEDIVCRYGGEEFLIIIPETDSDGAAILGNRIRSCLKATKFFVRNGITFSAGTATFPASARDIDSLIRAADTALYQAKYAGKDRVIAATLERRKFDRLSENWSFDIFDEASTSPQTGITTHNISLGGIQFESKERYQINTNLHMVFANTKDELGGAEADGYITWVRKNRGSYLYGVRFNNIPENFQEKFQQSAKYLSQTV